MISWYIVEILGLINGVQGTNTKDPSTFFIPQSFHLLLCFFNFQLFENFGSSAGVFNFLIFLLLGFVHRKAEMARRIPSLFQFISIIVFGA